MRERTSDEPRVLLVEDDGITAWYLRSCLQSAGYPPPIIVATAEDALRLAAAKPPDLVVMDVILRGAMDGVEVADQIRRSTGTPVVFVTARGDEATRERAMAVGASGYLVKPVLERELTATVERALDRAKANGHGWPEAGARVRAEADLDRQERPHSGMDIQVGAQGGIGIRVRRQGGQEPQDGKQERPGVQVGGHAGLASEMGGHAGLASEMGGHAGPPLPAASATSQQALAWQLADRWGDSGAYEELRALADELHRQNDELARTRWRVEAERQRYQLLFELAPDGYVVTDATGVIQEANRSAGQLLGVEPAHLAGKPLSIFVPYGGHDGLYRELGYLERDHERRQWQATLRPRGRQPFDAALTILPVRNPNGGAMSLHWMIRDISAQTAAEQALRRTRDSLEARVRERTAELVRLNAALESEIAERKRTEDSLRESRQLLQSIADAAPNMLYAYDLDRGALTYANSSTEAFLGGSPGVAGFVALERGLDLVHPEDQERILQHREQLLAAADGEVVESTLRFRYGDGDWRWIRLCDVVAARDACGAPTRCVGAAEDVTEQRAAQAALVRAERLADTGRLAASFAHEINNPLQGVLGCLGLVEEALAEERDARRYLDVAQREVRRAVRVVGQLRDLGRQARTTMERVPTDLGGIISQVLAVTEKRCDDQGVCVTWEPSDVAPHVEVDPDAMQQVFLNLVLNALDAMPDGGALRIAAQATDNPEGACVSLADDGPGIDPDLLPRLFESFATTKPEGLGLGLYISRNIVEQHGGRIEVETQPGRGTTFSVWLPMRAVHQSAPQRKR